MESCFPPLASLSLRGSSNSTSSSSASSTTSKGTQKNRHSLGVSGIAASNGSGGGESETRNNNNNSSDYLPKLDVIQDLDLYYIRQIACSLKELDLEQKIDLEIKMREGSAKLLAACNNTRNSTKTLSFSNGLNSQSAASAYNTQILEAAKNLLTSNERMTAYMSELQRRKRDKEGTQLRAKPTAKISLSEIRMPLMWRDTDHFKNKGDHRRFAVFCLAKIGTEIFDTTLLCPIDRNSTDISFTDSIIFSNVTPDFDLTLEVYAVMMEQDLSIASTPRKIKNTIHSSISRTVGKRLAANLKDELNNTKIGPKFALIATASLSLAEASDLPHTHDLRLIPQTVVSNTTATGNNPQAAAHLANNTALPLFGHFCCRLAVQPDSFEVAAITEELAGLEAPAHNCNLSSCYARLQAFRLDVWDSEKAFNNGLEVKRSIAINRDTKLKHRGESDLNVANMEDGNLVDYVLKTSSVTQQTQFYAAIKKVINEHKLWGHVVQHGAMELAAPPESKGYFLRNNRQRSLYDQVPILNPQDSNTDLTSISANRPDSLRPSVHEIFAIPSSPTEFRHRTYSSSRSASNGSSISINSKKSWFTGK